VPVAHVCNPSYSGGRDQEDQGSKPAWANSWRDPMSKNPSQKRAGGVPQGVDPVTSKKKKKRQMWCDICGVRPVVPALPRLMQ
jgi:hypothetical protein